MNKKEHTAVEWLIKELFSNNIIPEYTDILIDIAKEMEKKQIENAFDMGVSSVLKNFDMAYSETDGEDYYEKLINDKLFTINDIRKAIKFGWDDEALSKEEISAKYNIQASGYHYENVEKFIQSLLLPIKEDKNL